MTAPSSTNGSVSVSTVRLGASASRSLKKNS